MHVTSLRTVVRTAVALALAGSALTLVGPAPVLAASGTCEQSVPVVPVVPKNAIPDGSTNTLIVDMPEDGAAVTSVDMAIDIRHQDLSDVSVTLQWQDDANVTASPVVALVGQSTLAGANLTGTVLDDAASTPITSGAAPYTGRFQPENPLSGVAGHVGGKYVLVVKDNTADTDGGGFLDDWTLTVTYASCDLDADAVEDHADACPGTAGDPTTGCPVPVAQVTASYRRGRFRGFVRSSVAACASARPVKVWKVRPGPDRLLGTVASRSDGSYRLVRARHLGRYYATVPAVLLPGVADCPSVRSPILRLR